MEKTCDANYLLLNPSLRCQPFEEKKKEYTEFRENLETYMKNELSNSGIQDIAIYFRDLENGPWFGINEQALFSPASMLKLPLLIAYLKKAETEPGILMQEIAIDGSGGGSKAEGSLEPEKTYTIDDLFRRMIVESDNDPLSILFSYLQQFYPDEDVFSETLAAMGVAKSEGTEEDFLTVKRYASFYRALYNASFLSKETSERALHLLTLTESPQGIDDGVPSGIRVAHKFGIREREGSVQHHDCGIVYEPSNPYLLCIMTRGSNAASLASVIQEISRMVYTESSVS